MLRVYLLIMSVIAGCNESYISKKREGLRPYDDHDARSQQSQEESRKVNRKD
jgi:hypothetical protein